MNRSVRRVMVGVAGLAVLGMTATPAGARAHAPAPERRSVTVRMVAPKWWWCSGAGSLWGRRRGRSARESTQSTSRTLGTAAFDHDPTQVRNCQV